MPRRTFICPVIGMLLTWTNSAVNGQARSASIVALQGSHGAASSDPLLEGFRNPPKPARPGTYFLLLNGYVNRAHIERELRQLADTGIGGLCVFDMGARGLKTAMPPAGPPFLSRESVQDLAHVIRIATKLDMEVQLSVASSWDMGGSWVEPQHASMALYHTELTVDGPIPFDDRLPFPNTPAGAPKRADGRPAFYKEVAVLGIPAPQRLPGHEFVFRLDPPEVHTINRVVLYNTVSGEMDRYGPTHLFTKDFSVAVSTQPPEVGTFREVLTGSLEPTTEAQRFDFTPVKASYVRLRILSGHNRGQDRVQLGEFEVLARNGVNVVASHQADRRRDGAELLHYTSALGHLRTWTADNIHDGVKNGPRGSWSSSGPPPFLIAEPDAIVDLTENVDADGRLKWNVPPGRWAILRFVCTNTGERLKVPSPNSDGLATDHLSSQATEAFVQYVVDRIGDGLGDVRNTALKRLYLASYEVRGQIWTPDFLDQFRRYRGYDMTRFLPVLVGSVVGSDQMTHRFKYDFRKTVGDLLVDAYYRTARTTASRAGLGIESEAGGPGPPIHQVPVDALKALGSIDAVRGEFWPKRPLANRMWVVKETACAAHIYGHRRVHMEAFTSTHHWQDGPSDLKPSADRAFCEGANHFVWHTASHLPPEAGQPGWVYGAGTHLNPNLVWWPMAKPFLDYLARCSYLLQQGLFVADVCYYYGDQGYNFVPPKHIDPSLGYGFDYDVTNAEVILTRMSVRDGRIVLPDGMSYELLVLPDRQDMDLEVLQKLERLVAAGATVVGPKPTRSNGLADYPHRDERVRHLAEKLWGPCDGEAVREHQYGKGRVAWNRAPRELLQQSGMGPDFSFVSHDGRADLDYIHRRTHDADIYFVRNRLADRATVNAEFRVRGRMPELWHPDTGDVRPQAVYRQTANGTSLPLHLAPHGSVFVIFRRPIDGPHIVSLRIDKRSEARDAAIHPGSIPAVELVGFDGERATLRALRGATGTVQVSDGRVAHVALAGPGRARELTGPWSVRFSGPGKSDTVSMPELISWTQHADSEIRYFSGVAVYERSFTVPREWLSNGRRVYLDFGDLWAIGRVYVNKQSVGVVWKQPYRVDVTNAAKPGENHLTLEVANTWSNRLVGDARRRDGKRLTRTNIERTGGTMWRDAPLLNSGLFGPVHLVPAFTTIVQAK